MKLQCLISLLFFHGYASAQQSAAGQDTVIGVVGRDFVMMGADTSSSGGGGISLTSSNIDKLALIHDGGGNTALSNSIGCLMHQRSLEQQAILVGFAGDAADADRLAGKLTIHTQVKEYELGLGNDVVCTFDGLSSSTSNNFMGTVSPAGLDAESIANFARKEIAARMRSRQPLQLCLLVGGMVRCASSRTHSSSSSLSNSVQKQVSGASSAYIGKDGDGNQEDQINHDVRGIRTQPSFLSPKLFWLDQYGSLQNISYGCHGFGSNFALSVLDQRYQKDMSRQDAEELIMECFEQLRKRFLINSPQPPRIKCLDAFGVREIDSKYKK